MAPYTSIITAEKVTKKFNSFTAVDNVSFKILEGAACGFVGPNGAGKTTMMRMIACLSPLTYGVLIVDNKNTDKDQIEIKSIIGLVPQLDNLDPDLTVIHNLLVYSRYFSIPKAEAAKRANNLIELMHLTEKKDALISQLSGGMRRRLLIARSLINSPKILILDEPTAGLDPKIKREIWQKLKELKSHGITLLITTHDMQEAEIICDMVLVMDKGKIIAQGKPRDLIEKVVGGKASLEDVFLTLTIEGHT